MPSMKKKGFNWQLLVGFLLCLFALASFPVIFAQFGLTKDSPWLNLVIFAVALIFVLVGLRRSFAPERGKIARIAALFLAFLSVAFLGLYVFAAFVMSTWLPKSAAAPQVGQKAPDFTLTDTSGKQVSLSGLLADKKGVILVFYRGYW